MAGLFLTSRKTTTFLETRLAYYLEQDEAAEALGVTVQDIEDFDRGVRESPHPIPWLKKVFWDHFVSLQGSHKNLMYGTSPLSILRHLDGHTLERIASRFGYTPSEWREFELHQKKLPEEKIDVIERYHERRLSIAFARSWRD